MDEQGNKSSDGENSTQSDLASKKFMKQNDRVSASSSVTPPLSFDLPGTASGSTATSIHNITPYKSKSESIIRVHERLTESFAMTSISFTGNMSGNRNEARHNDINSSDAAGSPKLKKPSHVSFVMEETSKEEEQKQTNTELETRIDLPILNLEELNNLEVNDGKAVQNKSEQLLIPRESMSSISSNVCRICMTAGKERLISPCNCKGSLANVHLSCLERWLNQVGRNYCELCGFCYPAVRTPRYTMLQALRLWFCNPRNRTHLQSDCLIFWLLTTVTAGLLSVCIVGTQYFAVEGNRYHRSAAHSRSSGISQRVSESAMDFFMAIIICGYSMTVYLLWKDHYVMWSSVIIASLWRSTQEQGQEPMLYNRETITKNNILSDHNLCVSLAV